MWYTVPILEGGLIMASLVITIGRECGSGGHTIGKLLSQRLGLPFYDKEIVELVAAKTKLSPEFINTHGEYFQGGSLGHIIGYGTRFDGAAKTGSSLTDHLQQAQAETVLEVAQKEPCVIVGRCADYVLKGKVPTLNVFIHSEMSYKVERSAEEHGLLRDKAEATLLRRDKARAQSYKFYTDQKWGDVKNYDLCLDSGKLGVENCVAIIADAYNRMKDRTK